MSRIGSVLSAAVMMALSQARAIGQAARISLPTMPINWKGEVQLAPMTYGHRGAGISMASQKRASQKRKNRARHKSLSRN